MQYNIARIINATQHKPSYLEHKKPVSLFNTFVVLLIVNASSTSLVVWSLGLETTARGHDSRYAEVRSSL